jgi:hypothetical protein
VQVYVLDKDPICAAELLENYPRRAMATNLREGQQILSVCLANRGLPTLIKEDGTRYSGVNHKNHPLVKWFSESDIRVFWLYEHLQELTYLFYPGHYVRLLDHLLNTDGSFVSASRYLDSIPWFPAKEYDGPEDVRAYLEWKYPAKRINTQYERVAAKCNDRRE